jgi:hypothetical protein
MQVVACKSSQQGVIFKPHFEDSLHTDETGAPRPEEARRGRAPAVISLIILGAITVFVVWDTTDAG